MHAGSASGWASSPTPGSAVGLAVVRSPSTFWSSLKYSILSCSKLVSVKRETNCKCLWMFAKELIGSHRPESNKEQV